MDGFLSSFAIHCGMVGERRREHWTYQYVCAIRRQLNLLKWRRGSLSGVEPIESKNRKRNFNGRTLDILRNDLDPASQQPGGPVWLLLVDDSLHRRAIVVSIVAVGWYWMVY